MTGLKLGSVALLTLAIAGGDALHSMPGRTGPPSIRVELVGRDGAPVGTAQLTEEAGGVRISVEVAGLRPGRRAIHVHETGRCEAPDFDSAGAHFNPGGTRHGFENPNGPHAGDLPNIVVQSDGTGRNAPLTAAVTLGPGDHSLVREGGTSLVVHAEADDYYTHPSGNAGERVACGVIRPPADRP